MYSNFAMSEQQRIVLWMVVVQRYSDSEVLLDALQNWRVLRRHFSQR